MPSTASERDVALHCLAAVHLYASLYRQGRWAVVRRSCMSAARQVTTIDQNEAARSEVGESAPAPAGIGSTRSEPVRPLRRRLSDERLAITHHFSIAGHEGYLTVGLYEDGSPGEIFVRMAKEGS